MSTIKPTQAELKHAYQLVTNDLFHSLIKAKHGEIIRLANLGSFKKTEHQMKSALDGNSYVYYRLKFSMFSQLKKEMNKSLERKYKR